MGYGVSVRVVVVTHYMPLYLNSASVVIDITAQVASLHFKFSRNMDNGLPGFEHGSPAVGPLTQTRPSEIPQNADVNMALGGSKATRHQHGFRWQHRPPALK